ncbi:MAG: glycosyltransferase family 2 protein [Sphingobacteriales bacterium]|jgi:glycosyltransferase involved in cell wall biosynthesis|nr:glycosyltransferase family 2 protein [Sphingobacteriales bacterium]MBP9141423.1 glycosyltransferase family 2 protein [Chitinophagales bacterium]MDA0197533.1 glycosyltransferase family 2 protein [Bacteroidota bacterium]MBK6890581.1 glycosyltransferase family 2 protein [Sphingobacteriales bacterium]MBK7526368.1 glycosyltransferase family 2 protein [Sphingobacteriales bacterium]
MIVSGFTFVRNAVLYDYPVVESITSMLPLCDEVVVCLGNSTDTTEALVRSIDSPKIKIINSVWDESLRKGGRVLAIETNKALQAIRPDADWALYLQADEVLHEQFLPHLTNSMQTHLNNKKVEGLLFDYLHFYGSYHYIGTSRRWYRHEVRVVRNLKGVSSWGDAQGFRINGKKLQVKPANASIYHYGWVKHPQQQQLKQQTFNKLWHSDEWVQQHVANTPNYNYHQIDSLAKFTQTHPLAMQKRVAAQNWQFNFDTTQQRLSIKNKILLWIENKTGWRPFEYKNYTLV